MIIQGLQRYLIVPGGDKDLGVKLCVLSRHIRSNDHNNNNDYAIIITGCYVSTNILMTLYDL